MVRLFLSLTFLVVLCFGAPARAATGEETIQRIIALNAEASTAFETGDFARAAEAGQQAAELFLTVGPSSHFAYGNILHNLGMAHEALGNYAAAEPLLRRALAIAESSKGPDSESAANRLNSLGSLLIDTGEFREAEQLLKRSLALWETLKGPASRDAGRVLNNLGSLYRDMARYDEAVAVLERATAIHSDPASAEGAAGAAGLIGPEGFKLLGAAQNNLALAQEDMGDYAAAEKTYNRAIAQRMLGIGGDGAELAITYANFASLLANGGHFEDAEAYSKRAIEVLLKTRGVAHPEVATAKNNLAGLYRLWGKPDLAFPLYREALAIRETVFGPEHPDVADSLNSLGLLAVAQGQGAEAVSILNRALSIRKKVLAPSHPSIAKTIGNLAAAELQLKDFSGADRHLTESIALLAQAYGPDHPGIADGESNLGYVHFAQQDWRAAARHFEIAMDILSRRTATAAGVLGGELGGKAASAVLQASPYAGALRAYDRLPQDERDAALPKAFAAAQAMATSSAGGSLSQMAARQSQKDPALTSLVRERQDITAEWRAADDRMLAIISLPIEQRDGNETTALQNRQREIETRVTAIDAALLEKFPGYMELANPKPAGIAQMQAALQPDEAALIYAETEPTAADPGELHLFVITRKDTQWIRLADSPADIAQRVGHLRSLLGVGGIERGAVAAESEADGQDFDLAAAHALYLSLVAPAAKTISGHALIIVPSRAVSALPFHLLVSEAPVSPDYAAARWLVKDFATSYLPSATALLSLRRDARPSAAGRPYLGIGNPLLSGNDGQDRRAFAAQSCASAPVQVAAAPTLQPAASFFRGKYADVARVASLPPLPETTQELCTVARRLNAGPDNLLLGADASEGRLRAMDQSGDLAQARIVHFATHGLVTGELGGLAEPALVLTPPSEASTGDDGLLTASEVSGLHLDAAWVILSACNTAAGDKGNAEALSGLARSFFYAGARALLVSHWPVNSAVAVELTTSAVDRLDLGRAEALRQAMLQQINAGGARAVPASWAPFVVIGEGR